MLDSYLSESLSDSEILLDNNNKIDQLIQLKDWATTPLGIVEKWPKSLHSALNIVFSSNLPMALCWGPTLVCFYNNAYYSLLIADDSLSIGMPAKEALKGTWNIIKPVIDKILYDGKSISLPDQLISVERNGKIEDVYCTFNCSIVKDEFAKENGVLIICTDNTELVSLKIKSKKELSNTLVENNKQINFINSFRSFGENFRSTVVNDPIGLAILQGPLLEVKMANNIWLNIFGKNETEFIGKAFFDMLPELKESVEPIILNVLNTGKSFSIDEFPVTLCRGKEIYKSYFNINYQALRDDADDISGILIICTDVTSIVKVKFTLAESEKQFRNMVMQSPISMAILRGKNFIIEIANPAMLKYLLRKNEKDVLGMKLWEVFPELYLKKYDEMLTNVYLTKEVIRKNEVITFLQGNSGREKYFFDYEYSPLFEQDGTVSGIMVTATDVTKKVEARQRVETEETRLRLATESSGFATWDLDFETEKIVHSPMLAEIFGFAPSVILTYQDMYSHIHPDDMNIVASVAFEEALITSMYNCEYRIYWPDNSIRWIRTQGKIIYNDEHNPLRMIGTLLDITEKKLIEEEIARIAAIVLSSEDAIISKNREGIITTWNEAAEKMFGLSANEMIGQPLVLLTPPDYIQKDENVLKQIEKGKGAYSFETRRLKKDKSLLDVSLTISKIRDAQGNIIGMSEIARDITAQKRSEKEIAVSEAKFRLLANSMAQFIWTSDTKGSLTYFNDSVFNYANKTSEDLEKDGWLSMIHPDDRAENIIKWKRSIETGVDFTVEHRFKRSDGEYRWQLSRALPQKDNNGKIQMWVGTSTDIHEIKENEQQKDFFISMASHELKTPVTTIKGYVQILLSMYNEKGDPVLKNSLEVVNKQILTLTSLITDLLDLSKIKSGSLQLKLEHFCIDDLISEIVKEIQLTEPNSIIVFQKSATLMVLADRGRIGQVLINFLTNAIKYSPDKKEVKILVTLINNEVMITVEDYGIGIGKVDQQKIFQRFYRVSGKDEKTFPGFGIGLFIAAEIIQRHHGKIGVESNLGKGSLFYFSLPLNKNLEN